LPLGTNFEEQSQGVELAGIGARGQQVAENAQVDFYLRPKKVSEPADNEVVFAQRCRSRRGKPMKLRSPISKVRGRMMDWLA
jgi:hypothetical protein